ncbi:ABC transporter transmembrane domain-containing protein [Pelagibacterales bacterium]|jgi:subfamily B ATP-binding cassette protein MsbA|nr:ABC transporter transmembrane domain-containing protein [Pelagibacterales bacterium]
MNNFQILSRLFKESIRPQILKLSVTFVFMIIIALATGATAWLLDPAIEKIFLEKDATMIWLIPLGVIGILFIKGIATYFQVSILTEVGQKIVADTQIKMFSKITYADLGWLQGKHSGKFISNFLYDVNLLEQAVSGSLAAGFRNFLTLICLLGVMFYQDWELALIAMIALPLVGFLSSRLGKRMKKAATGTQAETGVLAMLISENLDGTRVVKAYQQEEAEIEKVSESIYRRMNLLVKAAKTKAAAAPFSEFLAGFGIAGAMYYAGIRGLQGELPLNEFISFLGAMMLAFQPLRSLSQINTYMQEGFSAAIRIFELLDSPVDIIENENLAKLNILDGEILLDQVNLSYKDSDLILKKISLSLPPNSITALVGPSGSGKTSILNLIPRFFDPQEGTISIDGQNIKDVKLSSLRSAIALVSQEPILFDISIGDNIAYGNKTASNEDIINAAKSASAHDFILKLPAGYDTLVGEKGYSLSGGQKQRLSIARAFLKDAPILLLDEATSSLDSESEHAVQKAIDVLMKNRTTLVIAHRLSTIEGANKIIVLNDGNIEETGTHLQLIENNGLYKKLYERQF